MGADVLGAARLGALLVIFFATGVLVLLVGVAFLAALDFRDGALESALGGFAGGATFLAEGLGFLGGGADLLTVAAGLLAGGGLPPLSL